MAEPLRPAFSRRSRATAGGHGGNVTGMGNRHGRMATCDGEGTCSLEALRRDGAGAGIGIEARTVGSSVRRAAGERGQEPGRTEDASEGGRMEAEAGAGISGCRRLGRLASRKPSHGETLLSAKSSQPATTYSKSTFSGLTPSRRPLLLALAFEEQLGRGRSGRDGVDRDVPSAHFLREDVGHRLDGGLGRGIERVVTWFPYALFRI